MTSASPITPVTSLTLVLTVRSHVIITVALVVDHSVSVIRHLLRRKLLPPKSTIRNTISCKAGSHKILVSEAATHSNMNPHAVEATVTHS